MKRGTCPAGGRAAAGLGRRETPSQPLTHGHPNGLLVEKENNMSEGKSHFLQTDPKLFYAHTCGCPFVSVPTTGGPSRPVSLSWLFAAASSLQRARSLPEFISAASRGAVRLWEGGGLQQQPTAQGPREERRQRGWATFHAFVLGSLQF